MKRLYEIRFFKNLSLYKLAILAGVHQSRISLIENELVRSTEDEKKKIESAGAEFKRDLGRITATGSRRPFKPNVS